MIMRLITGMINLCLAMVLLVGCSRSPRVTFYTFNATAAAESAVQLLDPVIISTVTLPDLLDRTNIVVTIDANRVEILEMHRWAAPLKSEIQRIISDDLAILLKPTRVAAYQQNPSLDAVYRVQIDIRRFEMTEGKEVTVDLLWSIRHSHNGTVKNGHAVVREAVTSIGYEPLVAAQSRALGSVSRDLAEVLRGMTTPSEVK
ncbi:MAG: PqiC family protein [Desulfuromonadaceae bacterium]